MHCQAETGNPLAFRYEVKTKPRVNALDPKELSAEQSQSRLNMRATMLGNSMAGNLKKLQGMDFLRVLWEVRNGLYCN